MKKYENNAGVHIPEILLPNKEVDLAKWAVVACDQYTSQPEYWNTTERIVGEEPSTLRLMLPEMYLDKPDEADRIKAINETMDRYVQDGTLVNKGQGLVLLKRSVAGNTRLGLVMALDLECYDYNKGATTLIRATEGTIVERIPPRLRIRENAPLEMPHIIVLIDDPQKTVIEPLMANAGELEQVYDFELMQNGGHIEGWFINSEKTIDSVVKAIEALGDPDKFHEAYGQDKAPMIFAMGDGNHSFATAKANWEKVKATLTPEEAENHPARFALIELENVHDDGIVFEPIHRVLFNIGKPMTFLSRLRSVICEQNGCDCKINIQALASKAVLDKKIAKMKETAKGHILPICSKLGYGYLYVDDPKAQLEVGTLQAALDVVLKETNGASIDYIHGADVVDRLGRENGNVGFWLPPMDKSDLFKTVVFDGALPRKTFSMGEANEKRYYLECKGIKN